MRRRFSEQLILEGGLRSEAEFDELINDNDMEESLTAINARKRVTLKRHYYPEGGWGWTVLAVALSVQLICHGLQMAFGVLAMPAIKRFNKAIPGVGTSFVCYSLSLAEANLSCSLALFLRDAL